MNYDRKYLIFAMCYALIGMCVGIYMAASHNHVQLVTHAHILLLGFIVSLVYGIIHKLWISQPPTKVATAQLVLHQVSTSVMFAGLGLLYGQKVEPEKIEPFLAMASIGVLIAATLMMFLILKSRPSSNTVS